MYKQCLKRSLLPPLEKLPTTLFRKVQSTVILIKDHYQEQY